MKVDIYGVGYVGLTLALAFAKHGVQVLGKDISKKKINDLNHGITEIAEPEIQNILDTALARKLISFTSDLDTKDSEIAIVTIGTNLTDGKISESQNKITELVRYLDQMQYKIIILRSTVGLGTCDELNKSLNFSKLVFAPERTIEGDAINELENLPQIIAAPSMSGLARAVSLFKCLEVPIETTDSFIIGEFAKLVCNVYRDYNFAFANEIGQICSQIGVNTEELLNVAAAGYKRLPKLKTGPVSGPCLTKDTHILNQSLTRMGAKGSRLLAEARRTNASVIDSIIKEVALQLPKYVLVLGTSFKSNPETSDTRSSHTIDIAKSLLENGISVDVYDPNIDDGGRQVLSESIISTPIINDYDVIVVGANNGWVEAFIQKRLLEIKKRKTVVYFAYTPHSTLVSQLENNCIIWPRLKKS
jgi:UDP-N-acetyl-D-mannosaminuronic acid dehydrogenase